MIGIYLAAAIAALVGLYVYTSGYDTGRIVWDFYHGVQHMVSLVRTGF